jgi:hypothetical protein
MRFGRASRANPIGPFTLSSWSKARLRRAHAALKNLVGRPPLERLDVQIGQKFLDGGGYAVGRYS